MTQTTANSCLFSPKNASTAPPANLNALGVRLSKTPLRRRFSRKTLKSTRRSSKPIQKKNLQRHRNRSNLIRLLRKLRRITRSGDIRSDKESLFQECDNAARRTRRFFFEGNGTKIFLTIEQTLFIFFCSKKPFLVALFTTTTPAFNAHGIR